jgi:hypothetical protein
MPGLVAIANLPPADERVLLRKGPGRSFGASVETGAEATEVREEDRSATVGWVEDDEEGWVGVLAVFGWER